MKKFWQKLISVFLGIICLLTVCGCSTKPEISFGSAKSTMEKNHYDVKISQEATTYISSLSLPFDINFPDIIYEFFIAEYSREMILMLDFNKASDAKSFYKYAKKSMKADIAQYEAKASLFEYYLDQQDDRIVSLEAYFVNIKATLDSKKRYCIGRKGTTIWYGTKEAIKATTQVVEQKED